MNNKADTIRALSLVGFGSAHFNARFPDEHLGLLRPVKATDGANSVLLSGTLGAGKTSLLSCFAQELFKGFATAANGMFADPEKQGIPGYMLPDLFSRRALYVTHTELSKVWEREFQDDPAGSEDDFYKTGILFLDDLGTAPDTGSGRNMARLEALIDYRWSHHLKTFIASNMYLEELKLKKNSQWFRIARRLSETDWMIYRKLETKYGGRK